jgi:hypothetical protein
MAHFNTEVVLPTGAYVSETSLKSEEEPTHSSDSTSRQAASSITQKTRALIPSKIIQRMNIDTHTRLIMCAIVVGTAIRLHLTLGSDFPLHDGGLFYLMIQELQENHFSLPWYTSYNAANIPYLYPPFALYFASILDYLTSWQLIDILRILPAVISVLTIGAYYLLSDSLLSSKLAVTFSVFAFAFLPLSFEWLIMGGGLTRAFGVLFALLALRYAYLLYSQQNRREILPTILFCGLTVLSHPETAWFLFYSIALLFLFFGRNRKGILHSFVVVIGTFVLISPWLIINLSRHGFDLLLPIADSGFSRLESILGLLLLTISYEPFVPVITITGLLGLIICLFDKRYFLPAWLLTIFVLQPRGADQRAVIPITLLSGIGIAEAIIPIFKRQPDRSHRNIVGSILVVFLFVYLILSAYAEALTIDKPLPQAEREAMVWIKNHTPEASSIVVVTGTGWPTDRSSEWLSVLTNRRSVAVVQGYEWLGNFYNRIEAYEELQECASEDGDCLERWGEATSTHFTHVYIPNPCSKPQAPDHDRCSALRLTLREDKRFSLVYENPGVTIFERISEN